MPKVQLRLQVELWFPVQRGAIQARGIRLV